MYKAITNGHIKVVKYLLFKHFSINTNSTNLHKESGLDIAAEKGSLKMAKLLLRDSAGTFRSSSCGLALHSCLA
jgi:ankyrin repeat protein